MSLNHSLKQTLQHQWRPNLQLSPSIAMFYLLNPNANEEEIEKFAENNKIERQMVIHQIFIFYLLLILGIQVF